MKLYSSKNTGILCRKNAARMFSLLLAVFMMASAFGACGKKDTEDKSSSSASGASASPSAAKASGTTQKSSTNPTTGTGTAVSQNNGTGEAVASGNEAGTDSEDKPVVTSGVVSSGEVVGTVGDMTVSYAAGEEKIDLGGKKLVIADWNVGRMANEAGAEGSEALARWRSMKYAETKYNCTIEIMQIKKGTTDYVQARSAGMYFADAFMTMRNMVFPNLANQGLLLKLNDYINFDTDPLWKGKGSTSYWKGNYYGLMAQVNYPYNGIWYNVDFIQREGIADPYDLYKSGNWNWDTFLDACIKATRDTNGDGTPDQWGITPRRNDFLVQDFVYTNGGTIVECHNDKFEFTLSDPKNVKPLQFVSDLFNVYKVVNPVGWYTEFNKSTSAFYHTQLWEGSRFKDGGLTCGYVPLPKGPDATTNIFNFREDPLFVAFPDNVENAKEVVRVFQTMIGVWDSTQPYYYADEKSLYDTGLTHLNPNYLDRDMEFVYAANKLYTPHDIKMFGEADKMVTGLYNQIVKQEVTVASALESIKQAAQDAIDRAEGAQ